MPVTKCPTCFNYRKITNLTNWYRPSSYELMELDIKAVRVNLGYCPSCMIQQAKQDGFSKEELEKIVERTL